MSRPETELVAVVAENRYEKTADLHVGSVPSRAEQRCILILHYSKLSWEKLSDATVLIKVMSS